jgi:hypothetical protein
MLAWMSEGQGENEPPAGKPMNAIEVVVRSRLEEATEELTHTACSVKYDRPFT